MPIPLLERAAAFVQPWSQLYGDSLAAQGVVGFLHLAGLLVAGGLALAADRMTLRQRAPRAADRLFIVREVERAHTPVLAGLVLVVASGLALLAADLEALLPSPVFWLKMGLFAALLGNGLLLQRSEQRVLAGSSGRVRRAAWRSLRRSAAASVALWGAVLLAGCFLTLA